MDNLNTSLVTFFFLLILSQAKALNITYLLDHYSSFSIFNNYLTQTGVAAAINSRQTITLLVVDNGDLSPLNGKPKDVLANILRVHVLLDYYDVQKMQTLPNKTMKVPTLFQTTGQAKHDQGFLNMSDLGTGSISLGSAAKGETLGSTLIKSIASQPYIISILQISNVIIPLGIDSSTPSLPSSPPKHAPTPAPTSRAPTHPPAPSHHRSSAAPVPAPTPGSGTAPVPKPKTPAGASPAPAPHGLLPGPNTPTSDAPAPHGLLPGPNTPTSDAPTPHGLLPGPNTPTSDAPAGASADAPNEDTPAGASNDAPTPASTGDNGSSSPDAPTPASTGDNGSSSPRSVLGVSLIFIAMLNLFLVLVI